MLINQQKNIFINQMKHLNSCTYTPSMTLCIILEFSLAFLERDRSHMIRSTKLVIFFHFHHYLFSVTFIIIIIITFVNCCYVLTSFLFSWLLLLVALTLCFDVTVHHDRVKHVVIVALYIAIEARFDFLWFKFLVHVLEP